MSGVIGGIWWRRPGQKWHWFERIPEFVIGIAVCSCNWLSWEERMEIQAKLREGEPFPVPRRNKCKHCVAYLAKYREVLEKEQRA